MPPWRDQQPPMLQIPEWHRTLVMRGHQDFAVNTGRKNPRHPLFEKPHEEKSRPHPTALHKAPFRLGQTLWQPAQRPTARHLMRKTWGYSIVIFSGTYGERDAADSPWDHKPRVDKFRCDLDREAHAVTGNVCRRFLPRPFPASIREMLQKIPSASTQTVR